MNLNWKQRNSGELSVERICKFKKRLLALERACNLKNFEIFRDFITEAEEKSLLVDVEPHMKRLRYEKSHWDDVGVFDHFYEENRFKIYKIQKMIVL